MSEYSTPALKRRFISASAGEQFTPYELASQSHSHAVQDALEALAENTSTVLARELRRQLNHDSLNIAPGTWSMEAPTGLKHWLSAFNPTYRGSQVLLGFDDKALFSLSEVFFGGDPGKLNERHLSTRPMTDTDRRLANRILDTLLTLVCPALEVSLGDWQSAWLENCPQSDAFWSRIVVATDSWSFSFFCAWPQSLMGKQNPAPDNTAVRLEASLESVKVRLSVELARLSLNLEDLASLNPGDILPISLNTETAAMAGASPCLRGQICEHEDQLALRITQSAGEFR